MGGRGDDRNEVCVCVYRYLFSFSHPIRQNLVRTFQQQLLKIRIDRDVYKLWCQQSADGTLVTADEQQKFMKGEKGVRPTLQSPLRVYWPDVFAPWNLFLAEIFANRLIDNLPKFEEQRDDIEDHFLNRLKALRRQIQKVAGEQTLEEMDNVMAKDHGQAKKEARINERRVTVSITIPTLHVLTDRKLFNWRVDITLEGKEAEKTGRIRGNTWTSLYYMVLHLGAMGMSSDESDNGREEPRTYTVRRRGWRSREVTNLLRYIDDHNRAYTAAGTHLPGNQSRKRQRLANAPLSARDAIGGLPENLYRLAWIENLSKKDRRIVKPMPPMSLPQLSDDYN
jgi:hypothetical protein